MVSAKCPRPGVEGMKGHHYHWPSPDWQGHHYNSTVDQESHNIFVHTRQQAISTFAAQSKYMNNAQLLISQMKGIKETQEHSLRVDINSMVKSTARLYRHESQISQPQSQSNLTQSSEFWWLKQKTSSPHTKVINIYSCRVSDHSKLAPSWTPTPQQLRLQRQPAQMLSNFLSKVTCQFHYIDKNSHLFKGWPNC